MNTVTAIADNINLCCIGLLILAVVFSVPLFGRSRSNGSNSSQPQYVNGYLIRYKYPGRGKKLYSEGYPLVVDHETAQKALRTGDYELEGLHDRRILDEPKEYVDDRLN